MDPEVDDEYQSVPSGLREWVFIFILCSAQLFTQGLLGYTLILLGLISQTFGQIGHS